ncbi:33 kDa ribonucleoprotein, chloroplastic isoform X2 [Macadamia integrifolia]|uniref:33 kDa ribonucleoprotein, chloroplastic isoform X2 n=1 Tax=Macadamia integrifolia TaxID=60698 RepID=UPI001C52C9DE|nr:33 kDa ribonucleoprotein, chloroplastic isoform X2 [Macadamia integrifolia]
MAIAAAATSTTSPSAYLHDRITNFFSLDQPAITITVASSKISQILKIKNKNLRLPLLPLISHPHNHLCCASAAFDNEVSEDDVEEVETTEIEEDEQQEASAVEERRLYVGNLPFSMTSSQLAEIFEEAGQVDSVEIIYDRVTDRSRGFAFVTMGSSQEAKEAISMFDGAQVGGRTVRVNFPEVPRGGEREVMGPKIRSGYRNFVETPHKIYCGNLDWELTSQGLRDVFAEQPGLQSAKVIYDRGTGKSKGFGFVSFASDEEAMSALDAMNGVEVEGRPMRLSLAVGRNTPASPPAESTETDLSASEMQSSVSAY